MPPKRKGQPKVSKAVKTYVEKAIKTAPEEQRNDYALAKVELYHNNFTVPTHLTSTSILPAQGDGSNQIGGVKYHLEGFTIRFLFGQKNDRPNCTFRVTVFEIPTPSGALAYTDVFENITGNVMLDPINKFKVRKLKDIWYKPHLSSMNDATDEFTFVRQLRIPYRKTMLTSNTLSGKSLYYVIQVYDAYGSLVTDNVAYVQAYARCHFKDF